MTEVSRRPSHAGSRRVAGGAGGSAVSGALAGGGSDVRIGVVLQRPVSRRLGRHILIVLLFVEVWPLILDLGSGAVALQEVRVSAGPRFPGVVAPHENTYPHTRGAWAGVVTPHSHAYRCYRGRVLPRKSWVMGLICLEWRTRLGIWVNAVCCMC